MSKNETWNEETFAFSPVGWGTENHPTIGVLYPLTETLHTLKGLK